jgi:signal transduction histidine kinase
MNDFVHNAGHEFKTPLSVIDSNTQLILEKNEFDNEMIQEIKLETLKLNSLIDSLINLTNI